MKLIKEEIDERKQRRLDDYKKFSKIDNVFNEDGVCEWALEKTACLHNTPISKLKDEINESFLIEDTIADVADKNDIEINKPTSNLLKDALNAALERNLELWEMGDEDRVNIWIEGEAGAGKTSIIKQWARENNINLFTLAASSMDDTEIGGAVAPDTDRKGRAVKLRSSQLDSLDRERSVLFLDELNRAPQSVRATLLKLIGEQSIPDASEPSGFKHFDNLLFVICATNPAAIGYDTDRLDAAEKTRFARVRYTAEPRSVLRHFEEVFNKELNLPNISDARRKAVEGRLGIAKKLLSSKEFEFDTAEDIAKADEIDETTLNSRTLKMALNASNGTKDDFLKKFKNVCGPSKHSMVQRILKDYKDVDDKANSALRRGTDSFVFAKNNWDKLNDFLSQNTDN